VISLADGSKELMQVVLRMMLNLKEANCGFIAMSNILRMQRAKSSCSILQLFKTYSIAISSQLKLNS
jgi:hypothetical protein